MLQVRSDPNDRKKAAAVLDALGTNLSAAVNMLLKQIIITGSIPFEVKLGHPAYTLEQSVRETKATSAMEGMNLTEDEIQMLADYGSGKADDDELRRIIFASASEEGHGETAGAV